ncbi:hypothetical protein [Actinophytocola glycyrrhizae]|uniref:Uncharacterized protein n=1 Tax=Actinophytocola glycyrrhizae TaxID=2044873 RepID=A0ABV9SBG6_9PSEU
MIRFAGPLGVGNALKGAFRTLSALNGPFTASALMTGSYAKPLHMIFTESVV